MMGVKLKEYRKKKKMSQAELAEKSGVSRVTISQIERNGAVNCCTSTLYKIATALGTRVDEIFFK